jgi:hypothetical protein
MSQQPSSRLEDHPDGGTDLNPIINGNWRKLNNWINPAFGLTARQDDGSPPGDGNVITASAAIFTADDPGALIIFADKTTATILTFTDSTHVVATDSKTVASQAFEIYRTSENEKTAIARGLLKRVRLTSPDDKMVPRWNNTAGKFDLVNQPGYGVTAGQILFGNGAGNDATTSADLSFDDSADRLSTPRVSVTKHFDTARLAVTSAASVTLDFNQEQWPDINTLAHDVTFASSNLAEGRSIKLRIVCDGTIRNFTFPGGWVFVGSAAPASIAANKTGLLELYSYGTTDANVVARWSVQP